MPSNTNIASTKEHYPTNSSSSNSVDVVMQAWQDQSPSLTSSSTNNLPLLTDAASGSQGRIHMTSPLLPAYPHHASGPVHAHVDLPDPITWKDNVTARNLSLINGQVCTFASKNLEHEAHIIFS